MEHRDSPVPVALYLHRKPRKCGRFLASRQRFAQTLRLHLKRSPALFSLLIGPLRDMGHAAVMWRMRFMQGQQHMRPYRHPATVQTNVRLQGPAVETAQFADPMLQLQFHGLLPSSSLAHAQKSLISGHHFRLVVYLFGSTCLLASRYVLLSLPETLQEVSTMLSVL